MTFRSKFLLQFLLIVVIWFLPVSSSAVTPPLPAQPSQYVEDLAGVIDAGTRARLNAMLQDLEAKTSAQVVVLTINSLDGEPIEDFSHQTAVKWGIGQKGKDNGVLITVAVQDHKYRLEVGYGLEGTLPDSLVGSLGRQYLVPSFKKGDFAAGILAAVTEISKQIAMGPDAETASRKGSGGQDHLLILFLVFIGVIVIFIVLADGRTAKNQKPGRRTGGGGSWFGGSGGGWYQGGGGFSGGGGDWYSGGGGFSGGGGDFGGGGASGDW
jgi:uncharacterized protein